MTKKIESTKTVNKAFSQALSEMDNTDIKAVEANLNPIPVSDVVARIGKVGGQFFSVKFARKNDKKVNGVVVALAGEERKMLCRRGVKKYADGVLPEGKRKKEDATNEVLTVWDVGVYQQERKNGRDQESAGRKSYRRINLADVKAISIPQVEAEETVQA